MKILKLDTGTGDATILFDLDDLEKLAQLCQIAALAAVGTEPPSHLENRDDLRTLGDSYAGLFELAGMVAEGNRKLKGLDAYRRNMIQRDFPFTMEGQRVAQEAKRVDDMLSDVDGL